MRPTPARRSLVLAVLTTLVVALLGITAADAAPDPGDRGRSETARQRHDRVTSYWNAARVASATPRALRVLPPADRQPLPKPDNPGGGGGGGNGGGGGGGTDANTGTTWTGTFAADTVGATTGKIFFTLSGSDYVCSGSTAASPSDRTIVLTAGHCVFDDVADTFATNLVFMPDFDHSTTGDARSCETTPYGCWVAEALVTTDAWVDGDFEYDVAFAVMGEGGTSGTADLGATVGTQSIGFNRGENLQMASFGYPAANPYDGTDLVWCAGVVTDDPYGATTQGMNCDMTGGSSGGPWFLGFDEDAGIGTLNSVNSYKYTRGQKSITRNMYGPYFGNWAQDTYEAARTATSDTLVGAPAQLP